MNTLPDPVTSSEPDDPVSLKRRLLSGWRFKFMIITIILSMLGYLAFTLWGGWENVSSTGMQIGMIGIVTALFLSLVSYGLRFMRWQLFLEALNQSIPWKSNFRIYIAGFALTITPGKSGEALRSVFLKDHGVSFHKSFGAFFSERVSDLIAVIILASTGLWGHRDGGPVVGAAAAVIAFLLFAIQKEPWLRGLENYARKIFPDRFSHMIEFFLDTIIAFKSCFAARIFIPGIILGVLAWSAQAVALYCIVYKLGYHIDVMTSLFIFGFSLFVGAITLLPGGLGGTEVTMIKLLTFHNIPAPSAIAITLILRLTTLWFSVLLGMIALPKSRSHEVSSPR